MAKYSMYFSLVLHMLDTGTDIGVCIQFYYLAMTQDMCDIGIPSFDLNFLFILSVAAIITYRVLTAIYLWILTKDLSIPTQMLRFLSSLLDLEIIRAMYVNFKLQRNKPCNPQRLINVLEGCLESAPQALLQTVYLWRTRQFLLVFVNFVFDLFFDFFCILFVHKFIMDPRFANMRVFVMRICVLKTHTHTHTGTKTRKAKNKIKQNSQNNYLLHLSWVFSLISVAFRMINDDTIIMDEKWRELECEVKCGCCCNCRYVERALFRVLDVTSRIFLYALVWIVLSGWGALIVFVATTIIVIADACFHKKLSNVKVICVSNF